MLFDIDLDNDIVYALVDIPLELLRNKMWEVSTPDTQYAIGSKRQSRFFLLIYIYMYIYICIYICINIDIEIDIDICMDHW